MMLLGDYARRQVDCADMLYIVLSKFGIGAAILVNGRLYRGDQGMAGDLAHVAISGSKQPCKCGSFGCLEAEAATPALIRKLNEAGHDDVSSIDDIVRLVNAGDVGTVHLVRIAGSQLGQVLSTYVSMFNPSEIVIGGALASAGNHLLAAVRSVVFGRSMPLATKELKVTTDDAWQDIALDGAVSMAVARSLGIRTDIPAHSTQQSSAKRAAAL